MWFLSRCVWMCAFCFSTSALMAQEGVEQEIGAQDWTSDETDLAGAYIEFREGLPAPQQPELRPTAMVSLFFLSISAATLLVCCAVYIRNVFFPDKRLESEQ